MDSQLYISSAILGVFLAIVCIYGWRRIVPVFFFGLILVKVAPAQSYDSDDDVPAINEVRDAIQYQQSVLQYELQLLDSGGTQTSELQDISNNLELDGVSATQYLAWLNQNLYDNEQLLRGNFTGPLTDISNALTDNYGSSRLQTIQGLNTSIRDNTSDISNYSEDALSELQDISNALYNSNYGGTAADWLRSIELRTDQTRSGLWTTNRPSGGISAANQLYDNWTKLNQIRAELISQNETSNYIENTLSDSLIELEDLNNKQVDTDNDVPAIQSLEALLSGYGQWDTDNDVDAINAVGMDIDLLRNSNTNENTQIIAALTSISNAMNEISDPATSSPPADIVLTAPNTNIPTFETVAPDPLQVPILADLAQVDQDDSKLKPFTEIEQNIDNNIQHFKNTNQWDIPLFGHGNVVNLQHANMLGNIQETINGDMREHFVTLSAIIKPILTAFLIWIVIRWTTKTTISTVSG